MAALSHLTLLIRHGLNDPVMPATRDLFISLGVMLRYREYEAAHEVTDAMLTEAAGFLNTQLNRLDQRIPPAG